VHRPTVSGPFVVNDAAYGGHEECIAGAEPSVVPMVVAMFKLALEQEREGLNPKVRMRPENGGPSPILQEEWVRGGPIAGFDECSHPVPV